jgi:phage tail sheath protein FI
MSMHFSAPDVYVQEVLNTSHPIGGVGTSTLGLVGTAPDATARAGEVVAISNWSQFRKIFVPDDARSTPLSDAVYGFFNNGGPRCYIVNIPAGAPLVDARRDRYGLGLLETVDEVAIVAAPGYTDGASYEALLAHCEKLEDRVAILDPPIGLDDPRRLLEVYEDKPPTTRPAHGDDDATPADGEADAGRATAAPGGPVGPRESRYGTIYFPSVVGPDPFTGERKVMSPSGHLAGVWARTDLTRGVHKAPANEPVRGVTGLEYPVTRSEQAELNPRGINCLRSFPGEGIKVWGARTLAAEEDPFRYLNVRRLFNMLKESIAEGTRWTVFEPNDEELWAGMRRDITNYLTRVWRDGALMGRTPQESFFVKCDAETNPPEVRDAGQVRMVIGIAPVKPAEFVIFELSQSSDLTELVGG